MRALLYIGLLQALFVSCENDEKVVYIVFENSEGIKTGSDVLLNGVSVGKVLEIDLTKDHKVVTIVELSKTVDFPKGSTFEIQSQDLLTKIIHVTLNDSEIMIERGDTIPGITRINPLDQIRCRNPKPPIFEDVKEMLKN